MTVHELRSFMQKTFVGDQGAARMVVSATSFGYKFGVPHDVDLHLRRALPREPALRAGAEAEDRDATRRSRPTSRRIPQTREFLDRLVRLPRLPAAAATRREHKSYLSIGIGCTGGKHRSVYVAEQLARRSQGAGPSRSASPTGTRPASEMDLRDVRRIAAGGRMIGILLVTHGRLAEELKAAALTIQPDIEQIVAVALDWSQIGDDASARIAEVSSEADRGDGAVILTDMFGGTPTNLTLPFLKRDRVEIVTGVNLPMLLKCAALQKSGKPVVEIAHVAKDRGQRSIYVASDLLADDGRRLAAAESAGLVVIERELEIRNRLGLHARAAAKFVQTASRFKSDVKIRKNGEEVDGKSILGLLLLAASQGTAHHARRLRRGRGCSLSRRSRT